MANANPEVIEGLRRAAAKSRGAFLGELESRIRQLVGNMVDGRLLPKEQADALRAGVLALVRSEVLPTLAQHPDDALRILDKLRAYGFTQLEAERPKLEAARAARFPPPRAPAWPEIDELLRIAREEPRLCAVRSPVDNVHFAKELEEGGIPIPAEMLELYSSCDGFDLSCRAEPRIPVFSLLPSVSIDSADEGDGYPRRATLFEGGDSVHLSVYRDGKEPWWLVYEHEYQPIAKKPLDLRALLAFGMGRMNAPALEALDGALSWETYFDSAG